MGGDRLIPKDYQHPWFKSDGLDFAIENAPHCCKAPGAGPDGKVPHNGCHGRGHCECPCDLCIETREDEEKTEP